MGPTAPHVVKGAGFTITDDAGRELIDLNNNFTSLIHGNAHPQVIDAAAEALHEGASFGMPSPWEHEHAQLLVDRIPGAEQVRYANSGSEAVMTAVRLARAVTGRRKVIGIRGAYHGTGDTVIAFGGARSRRGVPDAIVDDLVLVEINDTEALERAVAGSAGDVAAILIDLLPNRAGLIAVSDAFLTLARQLCDGHGIVLIDDEVIGLRSGPRGGFAERGVLADLTVVGKLIGGGLPIGAVAGPRALMDELNPLRPDGLEHGGTFTANPVALRAGAVALSLFDDAAVRRLNALGAAAREQLTARLEPLGWTVRGDGSLLRAVPPAAATNPAAEQKRLWWAAYERGVSLMPTGLMALSTPMTGDVVNEAIDRVGDAVEALRAGSEAEVA